MYDNMSVFTSNLRVERGMALHKMIRLVTLATAGSGYLNFMGNEFGHPEWIDFPREGNNWSHRYARRQWNLRDDDSLLYRFLAEFDKAMMRLASEYALLDAQETNLILEHQENQLLGFERAGLVFLFSFNPAQSFPDYPVDLHPGEYNLLLDSDAKAFGGHGRIAPQQAYFTRPTPLPDGAIRQRTTVYLPTRTALVLRRIYDFKY
jgi:1,4-alpha-glucan branching enzyme